MARSEIVTTGLHQQTVAGAVTLGVQHEHVYELTGGTSPAVTLDGYPGAQVAIVWAGTAGTVEGQPVADGETWVAVRLSSGWRLYAVSNPVPGDETAPTAGTLSASSISDAGFTLTVTGASDDVALHASPFRFSTDNGATWSGWQASPQLVVSGLSASTTYQCQHEVRDSAGKTSTGAVVSVTTTAVQLTYSEAVLSDGPLHYLPLDDGSGAATARNLGSAGAGWTATGVTFGAAGIGDGATGASFGETSEVVCPTGILGGATAWTVEALFRRDSGIARQNVVGVGRSVWSITLNNDTAFGYNGTSFVGAGSASNGSVCHVAVTFDGANLRGYLNGVLVETKPHTTATPSEGALSASIGKTSGDKSLVGTIAGVAIHTTALSTPRILAHAQAAGAA